MPGYLLTWENTTAHKVPQAFFVETNKSSQDRSVETEMYCDAPASGAVSGLFGRYLCVTGIPHVRFPVPSSTLRRADPLLGFAVSCSAPYAACRVGVSFTAVECSSIFRIQRSLPRSPG